MSFSLRVITTAAAALALAGCHTLGHGTTATEEEVGATAAGPAFIDGQQAVFVQQYWLAGEPHYLIANLRPDDAGIRLTLPGPKPAPVGPWLVPAGKSIAVDVKALVAAPDARGLTPVVAFALADGVALGGLRVPSASRLAPPPTSWAYETGLDGVGAGLAWAGVGAMTDGQPVAPGRPGILHLVLAKGVGDVRFAADVPQETPQLPRVRVVSATSSTFTVKEDQGVITILNPGTGTTAPAGGRGTVDLAFTVPAEASGPVAELVGRLSFGTSSTAISYMIPLAAPAPL